MSPIEKAARALHLEDLKADFPECTNYTIEMSESIWRDTLGEKGRARYIARVTVVDRSALEEWRNHFRRHGPNCYADEIDAILTDRSQDHV